MKFTSLLAATAALAIAAPAFAAGFDGDTVNGTYYFPDLGTVYQDDGVQVAPASFFFATGFPNVTATVSGNQITLSFDAGGGTYSGGSFNGVVITDLTSANISGVTLDAASSLAGFDASRFSFTGNSVSLNLQGLSVPNASDQAIVDVSFGAVPEPATWAMMLVGVAGVGGMFRASRKRSAAVLA